MIRKLTLLVMVLTVAACADKTNNKQAGSTVFHDEKKDDSKTDKKGADKHRPIAPTPNPLPPPTGPVASSLERPQGTFRSKGEDKGAEAVITSCTFSPGRVDDRLRAGNSFLIQDKWTAKEGGLGGYGNVRKTVDAVDHHGNTANLTLNVQGLNGWYKQHCVYGDKSGTMTTNCDFTSSSFGNAPGAGQAKTPKFCSIPWDAKHKTTSKIESGTYVMHDGRTVNAVRATLLEEGSLICNDQKAGHGTIESVKIYSADVPEIDHPNCGGGTMIYFDEITKNSSGATVNSRKYEIIGVK